jgi:hypothetical protein
VLQLFAESPRRYLKRTLDCFGGLFSFFSFYLCEHEVLFAPSRSPDYLISRIISINQTVRNSSADEFTPCFLSSVHIVIACPRCSVSNLRRNSLFVCCTMAFRVWSEGPLEVPGNSNFSACSCESSAGPLPVSTTRHLSFPF